MDGDCSRNDRIEFQESYLNWSCHLQADSQSASGDDTDEPITAEVGGGEEDEPITRQIMNMQSRDNLPIRIKINIEVKDKEFIAKETQNVKEVEQVTKEGLTEYENEPMVEERIYLGQVEDGNEPITVKRLNILQKENGPIRVKRISMVQGDTSGSRTDHFQRPSLDNIHGAEVPSPVIVSHSALGEEIQTGTKNVTANPGTNQFQNGTSASGEKVTYRDEFLSQKLSKRPRGRPRKQNRFQNSLSDRCHEMANKDFQDMDELVGLTIKQELTTDERQVAQLESMIKEEPDDFSNLRLTPIPDARIPRQGSGRKRGRPPGKGKAGTSGRVETNRIVPGKTAFGKTYKNARSITYLDEDLDEINQEIHCKELGLLDPVKIELRDNPDNFCPSLVLGKRRGRGRGRGGTRGCGRGRGRRSRISRTAEIGRMSNGAVEDDVSVKEKEILDPDPIAPGYAKLARACKSSAPLSQLQSKPFSCTRCTKAFKTEVSLARHEKRIHGADWSLPQPSLWFFQSQCNTVAQAVAALSGGMPNSVLKPSVQVKDGELKTEIPTFLRKTDKNSINGGNDDRNESGYVPKNRFQCLTCQNVFRNHYLLLVHRRTHTGEKLFSCNFCDQQFISQGHLERHRRSHSDHLQQDLTETIDDLQGTVQDNDAIEITIVGADLSSDVELTDLSATQDNCSIGINDGDDSGLDELAEDGKNEAMSRHLDTKHLVKRRKSAKNKIGCHVCGKAFTTKYSLLIHSRIHTGEKPFACDVCSMKFYTRCHLVTHRRKHTGEKPYQCKECGRSFSSSNPLRRHEQSFHSTDRPYVCEFCAKTFKFKENLRLHIARRHIRQKQVKCSVCDLMFADRKQARRHERFKHKVKALGYEETPDKQFKCNVCGLTFQELDDIKRHKLDVHDADINQMHVHPYSCDVCGKTYVWRGGLREHMLKHSGEKQFACEICNKRFFSREVLKRHSITHTDARPFSCNVCNRRFKSKGVMVKHAVRFHFGEKQYSCEVCGKQFFTATELKTHKSFHTDEKLYACEVCDARLKTPMSLKRHMISHGERKFSCETCGSFSHSYT